MIPHLEHPDHPDASLANAEKWAARIPAPTYAIDDETAIRVVDGAAEVVSEGQWKLFTQSGSKLDRLGRISALSAGPASGNEAPMSCQASSGSWFCSSR